MTPGLARRSEIDGTRLHTVEWAPRHDAGSERRVLLVHGLGANTLSWELVGQPLADRLGAIVTAVDLLGFGRTRALDRPSTIQTNRRLVTALLDEHGPSVVAGNSMGAAIGIGVCARRPDLVEQLVLIGPAVPTRRPGFSELARLMRFAPAMVAPIGRRAIRARARLLGPERLVDTTLSWSLHDPSRLDPVLRRRLVLLASERFGYPEAPTAYADAARSLLLYLARGLHDDLALAVQTTPTLLVHGEHDRLIGLGAARDAAARHDSLDFEVLHGVGHAPQLEEPDRLVGVVTAWLDARMSEHDGTEPRVGSPRS